jgi:hypothetical protein
MFVDQSGVWRSRQYRNMLTKSRLSFEIHIKCDPQELTNLQISAAVFHIQYADQYSSPYANQDICKYEKCGRSANKFRKSQIRKSANIADFIPHGGRTVFPPTQYAHKSSCRGRYALGSCTDFKGQILSHWQGDIVDSIPQSETKNLASG